MFVKGLRVAHLAVRLAWLVGTVGLLAATLLPGLMPALGRHVFVVQGASMQPAIPLGSIIVVHPVDPTQVQVGQVVTYRLAHGTIVTHRVTAISDDGGLAFQTKGDASASADPQPVPASALLGNVEYSVPGVGFLMNVLDSAPGTLLAVGILGALLLVAWSTGQLLSALRPISPPGTSRPVGTLT
jgi:signal peptidase